MNTIFKIRKCCAYEKPGKFLSFRMFSTDKTLSAEDSVDEDLVHKSIHHHFYYLGDENGPIVLTFGCRNRTLLHDEDFNSLRSHF